MHYILFYDYVSDAAEKRGPLRPGHLELIKKAFEAGDVVLAGALTEPLDGAVLVFRSEDSAQRFAQSDPYVLQGLTTKWHIRKWQTVVGDGATFPQL